MDDAHVHEGYRKVAFRYCSIDIAHNRSLERHFQTPSEGTCPVLSHAKQAQFDLLARERPPRSSSPPMAGVDGVFTLGYELNFVPGINQWHGQPVGVGPRYTDHVALSPDLVLKAAIYTSAWFEVFDYHEDAGGSA